MGVAGSTETLLPIYTTLLTIFHAVTTSNFTTQEIKLGDLNNYEILNLIKPVHSRYRQRSK
jgi:hypothetical protein